MLRCLAPASTLDSSSSLFCRLGPRLLAPSSMPPPRVLPLVNTASTPAPPCTAAAAASAPTRLLSMLLPRLCVDSGSSLFCRLGSWLSAPVYAAASSPALLLSSLQHRLRLRLLPPLSLRPQSVSCGWLVVAVVVPRLKQGDNVGCSFVRKDTTASSSGSAACSSHRRFATGKDGR